MSDDKKHKNVLEKVRCLDEFQKPEHKKKTNQQLGIVAAQLLGKPTGNSQQMEKLAVGTKRRQKQTSMTDFVKKLKK